MSDTKRLKEILESGAAFLERKGVEHPRLACELLVARLLQCQRLELYMKFDMTLDEKHVAAMRRGVVRVGEGEPVQYVLGETEFMGHRLKVDPRALIPRPETEQLVELVLGCEDVWQKECPVVLDVGTGTGCISIAIALARPNGLYVGIDVSEDALALARENAAIHGLQDKIAFTDADLSDCIEPETVDALVTNPPYIPTEQYERLPKHILDHEPRLALDGGGDGMAVINELVHDAVIVLRPGARLFLEVDSSHASRVAELLREVGFVDTEVRQDLAGKDRFVLGRMAP